MTLDQIIAIHEIGHAIIALNTGAEIQWVAMAPPNCEASIDAHPTCQVGFALGGPLATLKAAGTIEGGQGDFEQARELCDAHGLDYWNLWQGTRNILEDAWPAVLLLAEELVQRRYIDREQWTQLIHPDNSLWLRLH